MNDYFNIANFKVPELPFIASFGLQLPSNITDLGPIGLNAT